MGQTVMNKNIVTSFLMVLSGVIMSDICVLLSHASWR